MNLQKGKFRISYADQTSAPVELEKEALVLGRMLSCDVVLNHGSVSRIHAGINRVEKEYFLINLSASNSLTLNGKLLAADQADVLAEGDIIQIGPFAITVEHYENELVLRILHQFTGDLKSSTQQITPSAEMLPGERSNQEVADVLKVFWEKRARDREESGTRLRPVGKPQPGKAVINWKPTRDLGPAWRSGLFTWAFLVIGALAVSAFFIYPQTFASKPLSGPHIKKIDEKLIAIRANENSCMTCHSLNEPLENACIKCHRAEQFHASNTEAHEAAGVTCTACHLEHQGEDFSPRMAAIQGCAQCHNDNNHKLYNGKAVRDAHGGSFGYPLENGNWTGKGLYSEVAETIPAIGGARVSGESEQMRLSRQFHAVHLSRLVAPAGLATDPGGRVTCSTCHKSFDPIDRETPRQTCAVCHTGSSDAGTGRVVIESGRANCVSCHIQHPYDQNRWSGFLTGEAAAERRKIIDTQIKRLNGK
jgi:pSer/pThr/pTyr-binding forkhead associated (FHA) protein